MQIDIPPELRVAAAAHVGGSEWLESLSSRVERVVRRWRLSMASSGPFTGGTGSLVVPVRDDTGTPAALKLGLPHFEARDEIAGLQFWGGDPTVRVLRADRSIDAVLLEWCEPGTTLASEPPTVQDRVLAELLPRLWRRPDEDHAFRELSALLDFWNEDATVGREAWKTPALVRSARAELDGLLGAADPGVVLATDLHAGNVLRAERRPWLVIDPKPFVGDRTFDLLQHLLNHPDRLDTDLDGFTASFAGALQVDAERLRRWLFVRIVLGPLPGDADVWPRLARALDPC